MNITLTREIALPGWAAAWVGEKWGVDHSPECCLQTKIFQIGGESVQVIASDVRQFPDNR